MKKLNILVICIHNSARSQMAEAFLNQSGKDKIAAESAGLEPGRLNPRVVKVMKEIGIDISGNRTKTVQDFLKNGKQYDYVITVCDETSAERCPRFPGNVRRLHWGFSDPSAFQGSEDEVLKKTREVRDQIHAKVDAWVKSLP